LEGKYTIFQTIKSEKLIFIQKKKINAQK